MSENISYPPDLEKVPEIFTRHIGTWQGEYIKTDTRGQFSRSFFGNFTVTIEGSHYRQVIPILKKNATVFLSPPFTRGG
ncbi:hypothetical protein IQ269_16335 [Tychonema sp. LEGE 07199]|uniref:hypothetical protein n=1 Tax=unclassified Tychonema TaxID=2642144 RepID=UPI00187E74FD|nr:MULTISPECIES: hypothetical protein [unclassified Tychonema]MBE9122327.1 hypothetical protein [Tychonema sp. LEGE 07199]MBE9133559.1 hypothetical protein [Tychonema sp. LEGE 07196]